MTSHSQANFAPYVLIHREDGGPLLYDPRVPSTVPTALVSQEHRFWQGMWAARCWGLSWHKPPLCRCCFQSIKTLRCGPVIWKMFLGTCDHKRQC